MKKSTVYKTLSAVTGASVLLAGCAPAVQSAPEAPAAPEKEPGAPISATETDGGVTYANGVKMRYFVGSPVENLSEAPNVQGDFSFSQDVLTPSDAIFSLFGTAVTGMCSKPADASDTDAGKWFINVGGDVKQGYSATLAQLAEKKSETRTMKCSCAGNPAGGSAIANADVTGVPLKDVIEMAGVNEGANTLTITAEDGYQTSMPLSYALERDALLVYQIGGTPLSELQNSAVQLWMPSTVAKYFTRNVVDVQITTEEEVPALLTDAPADGELVNRPNVAILNYADGETFPVGGEITFEGYADDYDKAIARVEFSLDGGKSWTGYDTQGATADKWVYWFFNYTPEAPGTYALQVRSVTADGAVSPLASTIVFSVV